MTHLLHRLLVTLVVAALLSAPCLSVISPLGAGPAHAAADHHTDHNFGGADSDSGHHGHEHAMHGAHAAGDPAPDKHGVSCCCTCEGWVTLSPKNVVVASEKRPGPSPEIWLAVTLPAFILPAAPPRQRTHAYPSLAASDARGSLPLFALTERFRL